MSAGPAAGPRLRIGVAQVDTRLGDLASNTRNVQEAVAALAPGAPDLVVLPELVVPGYPPRDLLCDPAFVAASLQAQQELAARLADGPPVLLGGIWPGAPTPRHPGLFNAALLLDRGRCTLAQAKRLLPAYDVFHEPRWFLPGPASPPLALGAAAAGVLVCEDLWQEGYPLRPVDQARAAGASLLVVINASPYRQGVLDRRLAVARAAGLPLVYVNAVGAHDELIFDGASFAMDGAGRVTAWLPRFQEAVDVWELAAASVAPTGADDPPRGLPALWQALVSGIRGFAQKNGLRQAVVGLSGGIDSALVATLAVAALGPRAVTCVALPGPFTDPRSTQAAREQATTLGCGFEELPITALHQAALGALAPVLGPPGAGDTTPENLQARLRALLLMALVNRRGGMLLNTSNQTELALGYTTLYGDMAGALSPIGDLPKPTVQALAAWASAHVAAIPAFVLARPPSAELKPDQVDPFDYAAVGPAVQGELRRAAGLPGEGPPLDPDLARMMRQAEHKRWQAPIVLKVGEVAFGTGRMVPVTRR